LRRAKSYASRESLGWGRSAAVGVALCLVDLVVLFLGEVVFFLLMRSQWWSAINAALLRLFVFLALSAVLLWLHRRVQVWAGWLLLAAVALGLFKQLSRRVVIMEESTLVAVLDAFDVWAPVTAVLVVLAARVCFERFKWGRQDFCV
jgi:hypothetical protein